MKFIGVRWWIASLLFGAAALNYIDRQTLSALAPTIQRDLAIDDRGYANVVNLFLLAYTLAYAVVGWITDRLGTRISMGLFVCWWSVANALTAFTHQASSLGTVRFLLGLGEAGVWPAASKAVSEWFPARERALAIGLYTMGATVGATVAPYLVIPLANLSPKTFLFLGPNLGTDVFSWRLAFIATGALGVIWLVFWLALYKSPEHNKWVSDQELAQIREGQETITATNAKRFSWRQILTSRLVWALVFARLITDPVWYFFQFWFPKYLHDAHAVQQGQLTITWLIYAAAGVGSLFGGWISGRCIVGSGSAAAARIWVMTACALLMPLSAFIAKQGSMFGCLLLTCIVVFAALAWLTNLTALIIDSIPVRSLGVAFSIIAAGSTIGGMIMNMLVATMLSGVGKPAGFLDRALSAAFSVVLNFADKAGYPAWFTIAAFLHPIAIVALWSVGAHRTAQK